MKLTPLLDGPVFLPLHDPAYFAQVKLDQECGTVIWPNGADLAPEEIYELGKTAGVTVKLLMAMM